MIRPLSLALLCLGLFVGCNATTSPSATRVTPAPPAFKALVEGIAQSGEIGSGAEELKNEFDKLKQSDASKAESLQADFDALLNADGNPAKVKQLAGEFAKKL